MSTVIRIVESADGRAHTLQIPGYDTINPVTVPSSGTLDLLTTLSPETLHALQPGLNLAVTEGELTVVGTITTAQLWTLASGGGGLSTALTSAHLFVGNASNIATDTALTGDVSITNAGVSTVSNATNLTSQVITGNGSSTKLQIKPSVDTTTAFAFTNAAGSGTLISIDTIDNFVGINTNSPNRALDVRGNAAVNSDFLAGTIHVNGGFIYLEPVATQAAITGTPGVTGQMAVASDSPNNLLIFANGVWNTVNVTAL